MCDTLGGMNARKRTKRAVGYVRVSVDAADKISPAAQEHAIRTYCASKGWELTDLVIERGKSAGQGKKRPKFDRLMDDVDAGAYDVLVAYKLDRVTRSTIDFADLWRRLAVADCNIASVSESFDTSTPTGLAMLQIVIVFAELERSTIIERITAANRQKRRDGNLTPHGFPAYGYTRTLKNRDGVAGTLEQDPVAAEWVSWIADQIIAGMSLRKITQALADADAPLPPRNITRLTKAGKTPRWLFGTVRDIMTNPTIAGLRRDIDNEADPTALIDGGWEPIIEPERWKELQAVLSDPTRKTHGNGPPSLLSGLLVCGGIDRNGDPCGAMLRPYTYKAKDHNRNRQPGNDRRRYRCQASDAHPHACQTNGIDADPVEAFVQDVVLNSVIHGGVDEIPAVELGGQDDADDIREQLERLVLAWARREITEGEWRVARASLDEQLHTAEASARRQQRDRRSVSLMSARDPRSVWGDYDNDERRAVLRDMLAPVMVAPVNKQRGVPMADRVTITPASA